MNTFNKIREDLVFYSNNGNFKRKIHLFFFHTGFQVLFLYRLYSSKRMPNIFKTILEYIQKVLYSCELSRYAVIGKVKFPHPLGIVIGRGCIIHDNVKIWQQVTLGGEGKKQNSSLYPEVFSNVKIFAGAKVIGGIKIHQNCIIGANAVVNKDVPKNSVAIGIPAKIKELNSDFDFNH